MYRLADYCGRGFGTVIAVLQRVLFSLVVVFWGVVFVYLYQSGHIVSYVSEKFHLVCLIGGLAMIVLGLFNLLTSGANSQCFHGDECGHDHEDGHSHDHSDMNPVVSLLIMVLPVMLSMAWTEHRPSEILLENKSMQDVDPDALSFLNNLPPYTLKVLEENRTKNSKGDYQVNIFELFYSAGDTEVEKVFDGLPFETEGRIRDEKLRNPTGKRMRLYRLQGTCCAADAIAIPLGLEFEGELSEIPHHSWVTVSGVMSYEKVEGRTYPILKVKTVRESEAPHGEDLFMNR